MHVQHKPIQHKPIQRVQHRCVRSYCCRASLQMQGQSNVSLLQHHTATRSLCIVATTALIASFTNSCSLLITSIDMSRGGFMTTLHSLSQGLMASGPPATTLLLPKLCSFQCAVLAAMTCTSLPLLGLDMASEEPKKGVPGAHVVLLMASVSSALLGSLLLGTTVSLFLARLLQVAHTAARSECHSSVPYHDADFAAMLSRIPSTTNTLTATDEHEPMLVEPRSTSSVHPGSLLVVHPNGVVPLDGTVVWGSAAVEYATQGKRTRRIVCEKGTAVLAGSVVREAVLVVQVSCMAHDTRAAQSAGYVVVDGPFCVGVEGGLSVA